MQSIDLSRSLFGCTRISLISAALFVGTLAACRQCRALKSQEFAARR